MHLHTAPGQVDHTVEVFIVYKDCVLLRKHDKYKLWLGVGGHIELNEDPNQAAIREVKEEVGLDIELYANTELPDFGQKNYRELIPPIFLNRHRISSAHDHVSYIYFARAKHDRVIPENNADEWHWLTASDLQENKLGIQPTITRYAHEALRALSPNI